MSLVFILFLRKHNSVFFIHTHFYYLREHVHNKIKMKNIKIFPNDWLRLHPYKQSTPVDSYYTGIANQIYEYMERTELANSFEKEETKQICIRMAAYFEDVISGIGIWRTFILTHKEIFGYYLPFYTTDDHYYDDEVNYEDVRFLLWHFTQQYHGFRKGTFVNPDNPANESTALLIYQLFCDEWTTAPENPRMQELFSVETSYSDKENAYDDLLCWFHYDSYLFPEAFREFNEYTKERWNENSDINRQQLNNLLMNSYEMLAYAHPTSMLALTSPQWLAKILPAEHPDHEMFQKSADESVAEPSEEVLQENQRQYEAFRKAAGDSLLLYFNHASDIRKFLTETTGIIPPDEIALPASWDGQRIAIYATPQEGTQLIAQDVEAIKDPNNPFYNPERAAKQALSFFIVKHCNSYMLEELMKRGMLADAQTKSLISEERGKAIIQDNWRFLARYFIREYPTT